MTNVQARLALLGLELPIPSAPVAAYAPVVIHQGVAYVSGQLPRRVDGLVRGRTGAEISIADAKAAARLCAISVLAVLDQALDGDLDRVIQCLQLSGFVAAPADFEAHSEVINGASELMADVFGPAGVHARAAVGVASLPFGVPVEVSATFAVASARG
jgi:enamine deaminase RidA (YjgF/YER057c/UK114 family)